MSKKIRTVLTVLLALVFVGGLILSARQMQQYGKAEEAYDHAQQMAFGTEPSRQEQTEQTQAPTQAQTEPSELPQLPLDAQAQSLTEIDLQSLRYVNQDVLGWIYIPDTAVSYPLMYSEEQEEYLYKSWDGQPNNAGSIFLERLNKTDISDFHTIIYGHNMKNGSMFGDLVGYWKQDFYDSHPYVYLVTDRGIFRYEIFAAYEAGVESNTYRLYFADDAQKQACVQEYLSQSVVQPRITPDSTAPILTLSTCTGTGIYTTRWVVQAVLSAQWLN